MELGWIDFSNTEREKISSILDLLDEKGVLDELGIAQIRDAFSNLFFPGITTIQTRTKYFLISAYVLKDLELNNQTNPKKLEDELNNKEIKCAEIFLDNNPQENGVIGAVALKQNKWVKRTPINIYWTGIKEYRIFTHEKASINEYLNVISYQKKRNKSIKNSGSFSETHDDGDAGHIDNLQFLNIPTYTVDWMDNLEMELTYSEAVFLKNQIIKYCDGSIIAFILKNNLKEILDYNHFNDLEEIIYRFPEQIQINYKKAKAFSEFMQVLNTVYNIIVSEGKNKKANDLLKQFLPDLKKISDIDINYLFGFSNIYNPLLKQFLKDSKKAMYDEDIDKLTEIIKKREIFLKGANRAKTNHSGEFDVNQWFAGDYLDYRFNNARTIIEDIFRGCDKHD